MNCQIQFQFRGLRVILPASEQCAAQIASAKPRDLVRRGLRSLTIWRPGQAALVLRARSRSRSRSSKRTPRQALARITGYRRAPRRQLHRATAGDDDDDGEGGRRGVILVRLVPLDQLRLHPFAQLVPELRPAEYSALFEDIRERGIQTPLEVRGSVVLDGRHRLRAAREAGLRVVPVLEVAEDLSDPTGAKYMLRAACLRRHLSDDQRALMAARWAKAHPVPRGGDRKSAKVRSIKQAQVGTLDPTPGRTSAAVTFGVTRSKVRKAAALLATAPELAVKVQAGEIKLGQALTSLKRREQLAGIERATLPEGVFRTLVADPPWRYQDAGCSGAAEFHYPTMNVEEISALPIRERAAENAHCYLWITNSMIAEGLKVLEAWGFEFKTMITWRKPKLGLGRYFRSQTEHVLFGVRGKLPVKAQDIPNFFEAPQGRHSEKPEEFAALVERASPGPYLELFARKQRPGWICWGAEAGSLPAIHSSPPEVNPSRLLPAGSPP